jgi:hypothetical protein
MINVFWIVFLASCYDGNLAMSAAQNVVFIIGVVFFYLSGVSTIITFYRAVSLELPTGQPCCIFVSLLVVFYPIFYLITLPKTMWHFMHIWGSPTSLWNEHCGECAAPVDEFGCSGQVTIYHFCYGILFCLCVFLYVLWLIAASPIFYVLLFPLGIGPLGVALHVCVRQDIGMMDLCWWTMSVSASWNATLFGCICCVPAGFIGLFFAFSINVTAQAMFLGIGGVAYIAFITIPSVIQLILRKDDMRPYNEDPPIRSLTFPDFVPS